MMVSIGRPRQRRGTGPILEARYYPGARPANRHIHLLTARLAQHGRGLCNVNPGRPWRAVPDGWTYSDLCQTCVWLAGRLYSLSLDDLEEIVAQHTFTALHQQETTRGASA